MNALPSAHEVLGAMITPAVLISASGTLVLSTSNRISRVVDRVRVIVREAEAGDALDGEHRRLLADQMARLSRRIVHLRAAMTALYTAIGFLVATSIAVGLSAAFGWAYGWMPIALGLLGSCCLLYGSILLVQEARLAVGSTLQELAFLDRVLARGGDGAP